MSLELISKKRLAAASITNFVYLVINSLVFLVVTPISIRVLGDGLYGIWIVMLSVIQFANFANLGAGATVTKYIAQLSVLEHEFHEVATVILFGYLFMTVAGLGAAFLLWVSRLLIASHLNIGYSAVTQMSSALTFIAISLPPLLLYQISKGILLGLVKNEVAGALDLLHNSSLWIGSVVVIYSGGTILHLGLLIFIVTVSLFVISTVIAWTSVRSFCSTIRCNKVLIRELFRYSILSWISSVGGLIFQSFDKIVVGVVLGPVSAGVYGTATSVGLRLSMIAGLFTQVLTPFASSYQAKGRKSDIYSTYRFVTLLVGFTLVVVASLLVIWMDVILSIWISAEFSSQYAQFFRTIMIAYAFLSLHRPAHQTLSGLGWLAVPAAVFLISGVVTLAGTFIFSKLFELTGAALANYLYSFVLVMNFYLVKKLQQKQINRTLFVVGIEYILLILVSLLPFDTCSPIIRILFSISTISLFSCLVVLAEKKRFLEFRDQVLTKASPLLNTSCPFVKKRI